ncbi:AEC family transporter [Kordiimonas aestuarii]|uniref:AEC family transporter n=1 Tax=Kordiimonas aestuarii TaxID=1005925 RepID=UPI0021CF1C90|nr:AEC family transporter [Kordiimonas aestuarii]
MADILTIIAPVFLLIMLGYGLGRTRLFPEGSSAILIAFVWYIAIPALLFSSLAPRDLPQPSELVLVGAYYGSLLFLYGAAVVIARFVFRLTLAEQGIFALSACFANGGFVGIPIIEGAYGAEGVRLFLVLLSFHSLTLLPTTTIIIEHAKGRGDGPGILVRTFMSIRQNPIILALLTGLSWSALGLPYPLWLERLVALPAASASPVGLFAAGLALSRVQISGDLVQASVAMVLKLFVLPVIVFSVSHYWLTLPDMWVGVATLMAALPSGMIAYSFAMQHGVGSRRAATTVLISTGGSALTLSVVLLTLRAFGYSE